MTDSSKAVFLSYASQDAEAATRICESLRAAGIEVWFDQSELRGGDAWDAAIRKQIRACALFFPVISRNTHAREEGYFRLEWKLAVDRSHLMTTSKTFVLPVVIDDTRDDDENVPDKFRELQWSRLPAGETSPAFVERIRRLLSEKEIQASAAGQPPADLTTVPQQPAPKRAVSRRPGRVLVLAAVAVALVGAGYLAVDKFVLPEKVEVDTQSAAAAAAVAPGAIPEKSIAVLPFVDMSEQKDQEFFSDGLSEELIDLLSKTPDLRVPARTSSFYFKGKSEDVATIAQKLRVAHVLEGSVRKSGNTLRVTAQLIRADNGYHLWSETYDRNAKDIFKVQDEIAAAVVVALKTKLTSTQQVSSRRTASAEAHNAFLLGRQLFLHRTNDGYRRSIEAYRRAIALDPNYAAAYAGLALAEAYIADIIGDAAMLNRTEQDAEKAIALAPEEANGYAARGFFRASFLWDWAGARADLTKALTLDPADSETQRNYGFLLVSLGRLPEAISAFRRATELDPLSTPAWMSLGGYSVNSGDFAGAHEALQQALEIQPESYAALSNLGILQLLEGRPAEARATFLKINDFEAFRLQGIAMAEHTLGHAKESQQALDKLVAKQSKGAAFQIAETYSWRGETDKVFEWLERAYAARDAGLTDIKTDPLLAALRGDPRYKVLLRKMNLP